MGLETGCDIYGYNTSYSRGRGSPRSAGAKKKKTKKTARPHLKNKLKAKGLRPG
jgi:hypothetical protein